jgi:hypothetical protein
VEVRVRKPDGEPAGVALTARGANPPFLLTQQRLTDPQGEPLLPDAPRAFEEQGLRQPTRADSAG